MVTRAVVQHWATRLNDARAHACACSTRTHKTWGRPRIDTETEATVRELAASGMGKGRIARTLGNGESVTQRTLAM